MEMERKERDDYAVEKAAIEREKREAVAQAVAATRAEYEQQNTKQLPPKKEMETLSEFLAANPGKTLDELFPGYFKHA